MSGPCAYTVVRHMGVPQDLITTGYTDGMLCDIGMPVMHRGRLS